MMAWFKKESKNKKYSEEVVPKRPNNHLSSLSTIHWLSSSLHPDRSHFVHLPFECERNAETNMLLQSSSANTLCITKGSTTTSCAPVEANSAVWLHETAGPGHHRQRDFVFLQLEHGDEGGVVHAHRGGAVHRHDLVAAPAGKHGALTPRGGGRGGGTPCGGESKPPASLTWGARRSERACRARWSWWRKAAGRGSPRSRRRCWSPSSRCWSSAGRCPGTSAWDWDETINKESAVSHASQSPRNALEVVERSPRRTSAVPASGSTAASSWGRPLAGRPRRPVGPGWRPRRPPPGPPSVSGWLGVPPGTEPSGSSALKPPRCRSTGSGPRRWCSAERRLGRHTHQGVTRGRKTLCLRRKKKKKQRDEMDIKRLHLQI